MIKKKASVQHCINQIAKFRKIECFLILILLFLTQKNCNTKTATWLIQTRCKILPKNIETKIQHIETDDNSDDNRNFFWI